MNALLMTIVLALKRSPGILLRMGTWKMQIEAVFQYFEIKSLSSSLDGVRTHDL